ncbi:MAG: LL-diaminopimelate aminotransferase [Candidatus Tectomicrobia bacterium]|nr:LL-diaminopimelate aminotransferase [Candidatus Tectomicrobia bacterium]
MKLERAERLNRLPPYLFAEIDRMKTEAAKKGLDIISFGIGDPDLPTPPHIVEALNAAAQNPANHQYPAYEGLRAFRHAVAEWYKGRFEVELDPEREVLILIGSKEGIAHLPLAFLNPGDVSIVPDPGYPVYHAGTVFAGGESVKMPLLAENGFLPDLEDLKRGVLRRAKLLFLNYPNNPTAAVATEEFFAQAVECAREHEIILVHDAAYSEMYFDGVKTRSVLQTPGAKEVSVEFHSLSKTYNMTGWRVGFAVGNADVLSGLGAIKTNVDSGVFQAIQEAGVTALKGDQSCVEEMRRVYERRRDLMVEGLQSLGLQPNRPSATFYVWIPVPKKYTSLEFTAHLLRETGVVITPGNGFGEAGEGFVRMALTRGEERIQEALERIRNAGF